MQLSATQLAAAGSASAGKAVKGLVCFDTSSAIGALPTLALARVCTSGGTSLEGKDKISISVHHIAAIGVGAGAGYTGDDGGLPARRGDPGARIDRRDSGQESFRSAGIHGRGARGAAGFRPRDGHVRSPAGSAIVGKAPARESGAAPPASTPEATAAPAAAAAVPVAAAVPAAAAPATAAAASASAAPAPAAAPATAGEPSSAIATAQQQQAANHQVMVSADEAYMKVVQAESGNAEVRSSFLKALRVTRNAGRVCSWHDL
ncbi:unnamed protein product [Ectocarpus sp. CCAP 1310/34]|nr:unnamed protein product [Ectocarpus sp. CCAP 1310/34]